MREVGVTEATRGLEKTSRRITELSKECRFKNCTHTTEVGCAIMAAVDTGEIDKESYLNCLRMEREKKHFESTVAQKRKKDRDLNIFDAESPLNMRIKNVQVS